MTASTSEVKQIGRSFVHLKLSLQDKESHKCTVKTIGKCKRNSSSSSQQQPAATGEK